MQSLLWLNLLPLILILVFCISSIFFSYTDLNRSRLLHSVTASDLANLRIIGQEHVFEIKINYNGEFMVRSILFDQDSTKSAINKEPMNATPEKIADRKRGINVTTKTLFSSDSEKKYKRQEKDSASSSLAMENEPHNKLD